MTQEPRDSGGPIQKYWDDSATINQLEQVFVFVCICKLNMYLQIKTWLLKNGKKHVASDPPTGKSLSQLVQQFIELQEVRDSSNQLNLI